jgi:hypothetical protein
LLLHVTVVIGQLALPNNSDSNKDSNSICASIS